MAEINCAEDCGNSPKKAFLKEFHTAIAKRDREFILENISDGIRWNIVGDQLRQGKSDYAQKLEQMLSEEIAVLTIDHIITHGRDAAVSGTKQLANGETIAFCDVYVFSGFGKKAKVKEIDSFVIALDG